MRARAGTTASRRAPSRTRASSSSSGRHQRLGDEPPAELAEAPVPRRPREPRNVSATGPPLFPRTAARNAASFDRVLDRPARSRRPRRRRRPPARTPAIARATFAGESPPATKTFRVAGKCDEEAPVPRLSRPARERGVRRVEEQDVAPARTPASSSESSARLARPARPGRGRRGPSRAARSSCHWRASGRTSATIASASATGFPATTATTPFAERGSPREAPGPLATRHPPRRARREVEADPVGAELLGGGEVLLARDPADLHLGRPLAPERPQRPRRVAASGGATRRRGTRRSRPPRDARRPRATRMPLSATRTTSRGRSAPERGDAVEVDRERREVAGVQADDLRPRRERPPDLVLVVRLDEDGEAARPRGAREAARASASSSAATMRRTASAPSDSARSSCTSSTTKSFIRTGRPEMPLHRRKPREVAAEEVRLGDDRDRRGAARAGRPARPRDAPPAASGRIRRRDGERCLISRDEHADPRRATRSAAQRSGRRRRRGEEPGAVRGGLAATPAAASSPAASRRRRAARISPRIDGRSRGLLRDRHERLERAVRRARVDRRRGPRHPVAEVERDAGNEEGGGGVHQDRVAARPRLAVEEAARRMPAFVSASPPAMSRGSRSATPNVAAVHSSSADLPLRRPPRRSSGRAGGSSSPAPELETTSACSAPSAARASRQDRHPDGPVDADELPRHAEGVRERTGEVEGGADAQLAPHRPDGLHRRVVGRREEERDVRLDEGARARPAAACRSSRRARRGRRPSRSPRRRRGCRAWRPGRPPRRRRTPPPSRR